MFALDTNRTGMSPRYAWPVYEGRFNFAMDRNGTARVFTTWPQPVF